MHHPQEEVKHARKEGEKKEHDAPRSNRPMLTAAQKAQVHSSAPSSLHVHVYMIGEKGWVGNVLDARTHRGDSSRSSNSNTISTPVMFTHTRQKGLARAPHCRQAKGARPRGNVGVLGLAGKRGTTRPCYYVHV